MAVQKSDLEKIVGSDSVLSDADTLAAYSRDQSFVQPRRPDHVVFVETTEQVQDIVRLANRTKTPVTPYSSGMNLHGAAVPDQGGIILNMSRMNGILQIDEKNWYVIIEPGVTYRQLQDMLTEKGFRIMVPFGVPPQRSVMTSYLERDPVLTAPSFEHGNYLIMDTELVLPNGELFRTGNWTSGGDPGAPSGPIRNTIFRLWTGAQGTLGIMTKMVLQIEPVQLLQKIFFIAFDSLADAVSPLKRIQLREIGGECFLLNNFSLAAMLNDAWDRPDAFPAEPSDVKEFEQVRKLLPPWLLAVCINGYFRRPQEKIDYETEALREVCDSENVRLIDVLPNVPGVETVFKSQMLRPWSILKKFRFRGCVHDLTFKAPLKKAPDLARQVEDLARAKGYPAGDIGMFVLPLERGRAVHCEFDLHCPAEECPEREAVRILWNEASSALINSGAYFDRPYGPWAGMMYSRAAGYTQKLRQLKAEIDPHNILNPGKLCFS